MYQLTEKEISYIQEIYKKSYRQKGITTIFILSLIATGVLACSHRLFGMFFNIKYNVNVFNNCLLILGIVNFSLGSAQLIGDAQLRDNIKEFFILLLDLRDKQEKEFSTYINDDLYKNINQLIYSINEGQKRYSSSTIYMINKFFHTYTLRKDSIEACEALADMYQIKLEKDNNKIICAKVSLLLVILCGLNSLFLETRRIQGNYNDTVYKMEQICNEYKSCNISKSKKDIKLSLEYGDIELKFNKDDKLAKSIDYTIKADADLSNDELLKIFSENLMKLNNIIKKSNIKTTKKELTDKYLLSEYFIKNFESIKRTQKVDDCFFTVDWSVDIIATYDKASNNDKKSIKLLYQVTDEDYRYIED